MKAKDLRFGNFVYLHNKPHSIYYWDLDQIDDNDGMPDVYQSIPLTPEILEKSGFKYSEYYQEYCFPLSCDLYFELKFVRDYYYPTLHKEPEFSSEVEQVIGLNRIQYVHELQNLIFTLQGLELEIKL